VDAPVTNLAPFLKQIWVDYAPAVAAKPSLCDADHEAAMERCMKASDYIGCYEVLEEY